MKDRIVQFLVSEKISPAEFADKIGVQRSSMSHILNGRNYPSAAFIQKMLQVYPSLNSRWLMIGEGEMNLGSIGSDSSTFSTSPAPVQGNAVENHVPLQQESLPLPSKNTETDLFSEAKPSAEGVNGPYPYTEVKNPLLESANMNPKTQPDGPNSGYKVDQLTNQSPVIQDFNGKGKEIEQILFFYKDKTFSVYRPS